MGPPEKRAAKVACAVKWDTFSGPVPEQNLQNCGHFERFCGDWSHVSLQFRLRGGESEIRTFGTFCVVD
jgi:hypothetical protein